MKQTFYSVLRGALSPALFIFLLTNTVTAQLFQQDFTAGGATSGYVSAAPNNHKFTAIATSGSGITASTSAFALTYNRTGTGNASFSRIADFSPVPAIVKYTFKLSVTTSGTVTNVAQWKIGEGFTNSVTPELNTATYARFGLDLGTSGSQFRLRDYGSGTTSALFSGTQTITWVLNNYGVAFGYIGPDGSNETVGNDKMDIWIGNTKVFNDKAATTGTLNMTDLKFIFNAGAGSVTMDDFLIDQMLPSIICPADATTSTDAGNCSAFVSLNAPIITGGCALDAVFNDYNGTDDASDFYAVGNTLVTWIINDDCGNTYTCYQNVTVTDNEAPVFSDLSDQVKNTDTNLCTYQTSGTEFDVPVSENCSLSSLDWQLTGATTNTGSWTLEDEIFEKGVTTVTWTAVDDAVPPHTVNSSFTVTVSDNQPPQFASCPSNTARNTDVNCIYTIAGSEFNAGTASDYCGIISSLTYTLSGATTAGPVTASSLNGITLNKGVTTITWTATDPSSNQGTCIFTVTVNDNIPPSLSCPANQTRSANNAGCSYLASAGEFDASPDDNCSPVTVEYTLSGATTAGPVSALSLDGVAFNLGTTTVSWSIDDGTNPAVTCSFSVTVNNNALSASASNGGPVYAGNPVSLTATPSGGSGTYTYSWSGPNAGVSASTSASPSIASALVGDNGLYTVTVTDAYGCSATASTTLTVYGTTLYVNDNSTSGDVFTTATGSNTNPGTASAPFATISYAISVAQAGNTINVDAGDYKENPVVNKSLTINGANMGTAGSATRIAESSLVTNGNQGAVISITSANVTIDGLTINGDDPLVTGGATASGHDANTSYGVRPTAAFSNVIVKNNIIKNTAIGFRGDGPALGNSITANWFDEIGNYDFGYAISLRTNYYADVTNNKMTKVWTGLHTNNFNTAIGPVTWTMSGNEIHSYAAGLCYWLQFNGATGLTINNNQFYAETGAVAGNYGILVTSVQDAVNPVITNNTISGTAYGIGITNSSTSNTMTLGNTNAINNTTIAGVYLTDNLTPNPVGTTALTSNAYTGASNAIAVNVNGLSINPATGAGIKIEASRTLAADVPATLIINGGTTITGGTTGILLTGASTAVSANTLNNTVFAGQSGNYITLSNGALASNTLDAVLTSFEGSTSQYKTANENYAVEDKILHYIDNPALGFVKVNQYNTYVTANSYDAPATTSASVQRGIDAASAAGSVNVNGGSYDISGVLTINKALNLKGAFTGTAATAGSRGAETILNDARTPSSNTGAITIATTGAIVIDGFTFNGSKIITGQPANANLTFSNDRMILQAMPDPGQTGMIYSTGCALTLTNNYFETTGFNASNSALMQVAGGYAGSGSSDIMTVTGNTFKGIPVWAPYNGGNGQSTLQLNFSNCQGSISSNTFDGVDIGLLIAGTSGNLSVQNNTFDNIHRDPVNDVANGFFGTGILIFTPDYSAPVSITGNTFQNSDCGIRSSNAGGSETGNHISISANTFAGNTYDIVHKYPCTLTLANDNVFGGTAISTASLSQLFAIEDKIIHKIDVASYGLIIANTNNLYVTTNSFFIPGGTTAASAQRAINASASGNTVNVQDGTYNEDINITQSITLDGESQAGTIFMGPNNSTDAMFLSASGCTLKDVTVTRNVGGTLAGWYASTKNQGISMAQFSTGNVIDNVLVTGNRNGIYCNNAQNLTIQNCTVEANRTGIHFANNFSGASVHNNFIRNNFTHGVLFNYDTPPGITCTNVSVNSNSITGNWYSQVNFQDGAPANPYFDHTGLSFSCNWYGASSFEVSATGAGEPGYGAQIPSQYGGTDPGLNRGLRGTNIALCPYSPWLVDGTDDDLLAAGFQPVAACAGSPVIAVVSSTADVTCFGGNDGSVDVSVSGGGTPYSYSWSNGATTQDLTSVIAGTYTLIVTDNYGSKDTVVAVITEPVVLNAAVASANVSCNSSSDGSITITSPSGGAGTYEYSINGGSSWQPGGSYTGLAAGTYNVQIRDAVNTACIIMLNGALSITEPAVLSATVNSANITCNGANDGTITISSPLGGYGSYEYSIDGGGSWQPAGSYTALGVATHNVQIRDAANTGCVAVLNASLSITEPAVLSATVNSANITCNGANDGTITITSPSGGYGSYEYSKNGGSSWQLSGSFTGLAAASYNVQIRDAGNTGCVITLNAALVISEPGALSATVTPSNVSCNGGNDGAIVITSPSGGYGTYNYSIDGGSSWQAGGNYTGLSASVHNVQIRDGANTSCVVVLNSSLSITQPLAVTFSTAKTNITCHDNNDGAIVVTASGGTGTLEYSKNGGASYQASNMFTGLGSGSYSIKVRDANFCTSSTSSVNIINPATVTFSTSKTDITCNGAANGTITVTAAGGTGAYQYSRNNGGSWQAGNVFTGLTPANYVVKVRDANLCTSGASSVSIVQPAVLNASSSKTNVSCNGGNNGTANVAASGGTPGYNYSWSPGGMTTSSVSGLSAGSYVCTITDFNSCTKLVTVIITEPAVLTVSMSATTTTATATPSGGNGGYTYKWNTTPQQINQTATGLLPGHNYSCQVKDSKACLVVGTITTPLRLGEAADENDGFDLTAYPNPTEGAISLQFSAQQYDIYHIAMTDITGNLIFTQDGSAVAGDNIFEYDLSNQPAGMYFITVENADRFKTVKIVVQ